MIHTECPYCRGAMLNGHCTNQNGCAGAKQRTKPGLLEASKRLKEVLTWNRPDPVGGGSVIVCLFCHKAMSVIELCAAYQPLDLHLPGCAWAEWSRAIAEAEKEAG